MFFSVIEHIEGYLGKISGGWCDRKVPGSIHVVTLKDQPIEGVTTYVTLGLSEFELSRPSGATIRQELVFSANNTFSAHDVAGFLLSLGEHLRERKRAVLRGEVIGPSRPLLCGTRVNAAYFTNPTPFDDGFAEFSNVDPPVIFALVVPLTNDEAKLISDHGWNWFEDELESQDPDIWDLNRKEEVVYIQEP